MNGRIKKFAAMLLVSVMTLTAFQFVAFADDDITVATEKLNTQDTEIPSIQDTSSQTVTDAQPDAPELTTASAEEAVSISTEQTTSTSAEQTVSPEVVPASDINSAAVLDDIVTFNLGTQDVSVGPEGDSTDYPFDENGNFTIQLDQNAFFPYQIQFQYAGNTTVETFDTPQSLVTIGGHVFSVNSLEGSTPGLAQIGVTIDGTYVPAVPETKKFTSSSSPMLRSLILLPEKYVSLDLTGYAPSQLKDVSLSIVLSGIGYSGDATAAVYAKYYYYDTETMQYVPQNDNFQILSDENSSLDLSSGYPSYQIQLIVGTPNQLDTNNIRYIVNVNTAYYPLQFTLYDAANTAPCDGFQQSLGNFRQDNGIISPEYSLSVSDKYATATAFALQWTLAPAYGSDVSIYSTFIDTPTGVPEISGIQITPYKDLPFTAFITRPDGGTEVYKFYIYANTRNSYVNFSGLSSDVSYSYPDAGYSSSYSYDDSTGANIVTVTLQSGMSAAGTYYPRFMYYKDGQSDSTSSQYVDKAVVGLYDSLTAAASRPDIKDALFNMFSQPAIFSGNDSSVSYTIFAEGNVYKYTIKVKENSYVNFNGLSSDVSYGYPDASYSSSYSYDDSTGANIVTVTLQSDMSAASTYYPRFMYFKDGRSDSTTSQYVDKAVVGLYDSLTAAASRPDIKDALFNSFTQPAVFTGNDSSVSYTIFAEGSVYKYTIEVEENNEMQNHADLSAPPNVGSPDTAFQVTGAAGYSAYETGKYDDTTGKYSSIPAAAFVMPYADDSYYYSGYQTVLINDPNADLTTLAPTFDTASNVKMFAPTQQISGTSTQNFSNGPVLYTAEATDDTSTKNYNVSFVKKQTGGAQLFVNGPDTREVFLDQAYENEHDIFIANIGDQPLTGLSVQLSADAQNVKLDPYWTVGGTDNDTLAPFTIAATPSGYYYGQLNNVAKIRLLPTGNGGAISGTLTISSDRGSKTIILQGFAGNPKIVTDSLDDAVQYVPYSYMLQTDNIHDWNKVIWSIASGALPDGMILKPSGEIYGVPKTPGSYTFTVQASYSYAGFPPSSATYTLTVLDNSNANVESQQEANYPIIQYVGTISNTNITDYIVDGSVNETFIVGGDNFNEFMDFWLDGNKLVKNTDYSATPGSTDITLYNQTLQNLQNGTHTIAAEYRENGDVNKTLHKAPQNFVLQLSPSSKPTPIPATGSGSGSSYHPPAAAAPTMTVATVPTPTPNQAATIIPKPTPAPTIDLFDRFTDVNSHWAYNIIKRVFNEGLMVGISSTLFAPNGAVTYASLLTTLWRMSGSPSPNNPAAYPDIPTGQWYSNALVWALENNIVSADDIKGLISDDSLSRVQIMRVFYHYGDFRGTDMTTRSDLSSFTDIANISSGDMDIVSWCVGKNLIVGRGNGRLDPNASTTRAELAVLLTKFEDLFQGN